MGSIAGRPVCRAGIRDEEGVVLIISRAHFEPIRQRRETEGCDLEALQNKGQLVCVVADDPLPQLTDGDLPDETATCLTRRPSRPSSGASQVTFRNALLNLKPG